MNEIMNLINNEQQIHSTTKNNVKNVILMLPTKK